MGMMVMTMMMMMILVGVMMMLMMKTLIGILKMIMIVADIWGRMQPATKNFGCICSLGQFQDKMRDSFETEAV